jgi:NTE family protein
MDTVRSGSGAGDGQLRVCGWATDGVPSRPGFDATVNVPELDAEDWRELQAGVLSTRSTAGRELGWAARDLAGLKVGLALGAGSFRGYAHVGVLEGLRRAGIPLDYVAGTSIGAAVASLAVGGHDPDAIADVLDELSPRLFRVTVPIRSFLSTRSLRRYIQEFTGDTRLEDLPIPLALIAADILTQQELILRRGLVWQAILASVSIPGIYPAQRIGRHVVVDGGVLNPVPADVVAEMGAGVVFAVKLGGGSIPAERELEVVPASGKPPSAISVLMRSIETMQSRIAAEPGSEATTIAIVPKLDAESGMLRKFSAGRRYIPDGVAAVEAAMPRIAAALPWVRG